jgi:Flp pilus assembly protein TadD
LAEKACKATNNTDPEFLDTLAAAYAEAGRFDDAVRTAQQAIQVAGQAKAVA